MKRLGILAIGTLLLIGAIEAVLSTTVTGATTMLDLPTAGSIATLDVSVASGDRVVPHEYALLNVCYFSGSVSGPPQSYQREDIVNWIYPAPLPYGTVPHALMTVSLEAVPADAICRVFLVDGGTVVAGSTTEYLVAGQ
jgi:hypothetical protein